MRPHCPVRSRTFPGGWICSIGLLAAIGCTAPLVVAPTADRAVDVETIQPEAGPNVRLVKDVTTPQGMNYVKLESVALVTGLDGTGSDPPPSSQRTALIGDMQARQAENPNQILASPATSLVLVRCFLPPGVRKGTPLDVEVRVPSRSETKSLRHGWLMETRLREVAILDNTLRTGRVHALASGRVILDAVFDGDDDPTSQLRGHVLGGGIALASRRLGLVVRSEANSIKTSSLVGAAINRRFYTYDRGTRRGVATPKRDNYVELAVQPRYKHNLVRYMRVVQNIAIDATPGQRVRRMEILERRLHQPPTAAAAALQLEAIGDEAIPILQRAIRSEDPEVRFYAAEALAYLDGPEAAEPLAETARSEPAFRWHALAALAAMDHISAHGALASLLHGPSAETRYGAFRALWLRNPADPLVRGQKINGSFSYHAIASDGPPMIHCARSRRPEIVAFGNDLRLQPPPFLFAGKRIMVKKAGQDRLKVIRFSADEEDGQQYCSTRLEDVFQAITKLGGGYDDVLQCLQDASSRDYLKARVVVDALPRPGRTYRRRSAGAGALAGDRATEAEPSASESASPMPDMFRTHPPDRLDADGDDLQESDANAGEGADDQQDGFWDRLGHLFTSG